MNMEASGASDQSDLIDLTCRKVNMSACRVAGSNMVEHVDIRGECLLWDTNWAAELYLGGLLGVCSATTRCES
jgi:hypothetical protein